VNPAPPSLGIGPGIDLALSRLTRALHESAARLGASLDLDAQELVRARAGLLGLREPNQVSANGHSRFIRCRDAWIVLSLARREDVDLLAALISGPVDGDPWACVARAAVVASGEDFVERGRLLGLPIAVVAVKPVADDPPVRLFDRAGVRRIEQLRGLKVADLSSLWAGPLTAKILAECGAEVTKIESSTRPDGARARPEFYSALHASDQTSIVVDFTTSRGLDHLRQIIESADVVIEASRPRALDQLGLGPGLIASRAGSVWLSITGYGRTPPADGWVAFGDDGAAAGGLVSWSSDGTPHFVGDAIADPLTGMFGALGVFESLIRGGGHLIEVSLERSSAWIGADANGPYVGTTPS